MSRTMTLVLLAGLAFASPALATDQPVVRAQGSQAVLIAPDGRTITAGEVRISNATTYTLPTGAVLATWTETDEAGKSVRMSALARAGQAFSLAARFDDRLHMAHGVFDPTAGVPASVVPAGWEAGQTTMHMVQFVAPPFDDMRSMVEATGARVEQFMPETAYIVSGTPEQMAQVRGLPIVRWVGAYHPAYKLQPDVMAKYYLNDPAGDFRMAAYGKFDLSAFGKGERFPFSIMMMRESIAEKAQLVARIEQLGGVVFDNTPTSETRYLAATLNKSQLRQLLNEDIVLFVDPWGPVQQDMDIIRTMEGATYLEGRTSPNGRLGFRGEGVRAAVYDGGCRTTHNDIRATAGSGVIIAGPAPLILGTNVVDAHGTACYGINFGRGLQDPLGRGMCPNIEQGIMDCYVSSDLNYAGNVSPRLTDTLSLVNPVGPYRAVYHSSSVGSVQVTTYTNISSAQDAMIFQTRYLMCQSQSNTGSQNSRPEAWAKNIVSVGGIAHQNTAARGDDAWTSASFGPASDGRLKPDLSNCYDNVRTTTSSSDTAYTTTFNGTSSATPITAGTFGLLFQMWHEQVFPGFGGAATVFLSKPAFTTAKAMMVNTAWRYSFTGASANLGRYRQGWGFPDMQRLYDNRTMFIDNESVNLTAGQSRSYQFNVAGGGEFAVTMVYADPAAAANAAIHRINDLSVRVTGPTGTFWWGNNGLDASNSSTSGGAANQRDTVENVFIPTAAAGVYTVEVFATTIAVDGNTSTPALDATYALVVRGGTRVVPCRVDLNGDGNADFNDYLEFLNRYNSNSLTVDFNNDGIVDFNDYLEFLNLYNIGC